MGFFCCVHVLLNCGFLLAESVTSQSSVTADIPVDMKFTVQRYDSVPGTLPTGEERGGAGDASDGLPKQEIATALSSDSIDSTFVASDTGGGQAQGSNVARRGRLFARRQTRRLVFKDGECNISLGHISKRGKRFLGDIFTTTLDMRWRYVLLMFLLAFVMSWLLFGILWWIVVISHGDHLHVDDDNWQPCMGNVYDFITAFLFSLETQHTIGYGFRVMEPKCPEAVFLLMVQSCLGVFIQSLMTGLIFAKLSRPKRRRNTIMFSKNAVICQRDGDYCLLFRVADMRKTRLVGTTTRAVLVRNRITKEGEMLPLGQQSLEIQSENGTDYYVFLVWPTTIIHKINSDSPFWNMSAEQLLTEHFEIMVFLEGTVESTGMTTQVRTSYLPGEIVWGHRLASLVTYQKEDGQYKVDYNQFHVATPCSMPECSAKDFSEGLAGNDHLEECHNHNSLTLSAQRNGGMSPIHVAAGAIGSCPDYAFTIGPERVGSMELRKHSMNRDKIMKHTSKRPGQKGLLHHVHRLKLNGIMKMSPSSENLHKRAKKVTEEDDNRVAETVT